MKDYNTNPMGTDFMGTSKINAAGLINLTLENLWNEAFKKQTKNELWKWNRYLDSIWLILGGDVIIKDNENKKTNKIFQEFNSLEIKIGETGTLNHKKTGFNKITKTEIKTMARQYQLLMKKSLFLRRLQNKQGKGTAYKDPGEDDFD